MRPSITIDPADIARLKSDFYLMDNEVPVAVSRAINRAVDKVNTEGSIQGRKHYKLTAKRIKKNFKVRKSTRNNLSAAWFSKGRPVGLMQFGARQNQRGVSVKVMASGSRRTVIGAFIQIPRDPRVISTGPQVFWREMEGGKRVARYDIHRLEGPRIEDALSKPEVQKALQNKADTVLIDRLEHEANYILSKAR